MLSIHNARIVSAYVALLTVAVGVLVQDSYLRFSQPIPDIVLSSTQTKAHQVQKAKLAERAARLKRMNGAPAERHVAVK